MKNNRQQFKKKQSNILIPLLSGILAICILVFVILLYFLRMSPETKYYYTTQDIRKQTHKYENGDYLLIPSADTITFDDSELVVYYPYLINVSLADNYSVREREKIAEIIHGKVVGSISGIMNEIQVLVDAKDLTDIKKLAKKLQADSRVIYARYSFPLNMFEQAVAQNWDKKGDNKWVYEQVNAYDAWEKYDETSQFKVGVIDSGFRISHEVFRNDDGKSIASMLPGYEANTISDHGTEVLSTILSMNPNIIASVADITPGANEPTENDYINLLADSESQRKLFNSFCNQKINIINISIGWIVYLENKWKEKKKEGNPFCQQENYQQYMSTVERETQSTVNEAIITLNQCIEAEQDFLWVFGAGNGYNNGKEGYSENYCYSFQGMTRERYDKFYEDNPDLKIKYRGQKYSYDSLKSHLIIVGASAKTKDKDGNVTLTTYSNFGSTIDLIAPGGTGKEIVGASSASDSSYTWSAGTSLAAPIVTGAAAYIWSIAPSLKGPDIKDILLSTSSENAHGVTGEDKGRTYPLLDFGAAVRKAQLCEQGIGKLILTVKDDETGNGLADVRCDICYSNPMRSDLVLYTDAEGHVEIPFYRGDFSLDLSKEGYCSGHEEYVGCRVGDYYDDAEIYMITEPTIETTDYLMNLKELADELGAYYQPDYDYVGDDSILAVTKHMVFNPTNELLKVFDIGIGDSFEYAATTLGDQYPVCVWYHESEQFVLFYFYDYINPSPAPMRILRFDLTEDQKIERWKFWSYMANENLTLDEETIFNKMMYETENGLYDYTEMISEEQPVAAEERTITVFSDDVSYDGEILSITTYVDGTLQFEVDPFCECIYSYDVMTGTVTETVYEEMDLNSIVEIMILKQTDITICNDKITRILVKSYI